MPPPSTNRFPPWHVPFLRLLLVFCQYLNSAFCRHITGEILCILFPFLSTTSISLFSDRSSFQTRNRSFKLFAESFGRCRYVLISFTPLNPPIRSGALPRLLWVERSRFPSFSSCLLLLSCTPHLHRRKVFRLGSFYLLPCFIDPSIPLDSSLTVCYFLPCSTISST